MRMWSVVVTTMAWMVWLVALAGSPVGWGHEVATSVAQVVAEVGTVCCVILWMIPPVLATARVWHEIGREQQRQDCPSCRRASELPYDNIIPLKFNGRLERTDN